MAERIRAGVIGLGFGADVHVPALRQIPGVEVVALLGRDADRTYVRAAELGVPVAARSLDELLDADVDLVTVALPPVAAVTVLRELLGAARPVLTEKPLAADATTADELAARGGETVAAVDFEFAELPAFAALRELVRNGDVGSVRSVDVTWRAPSWAQRNRCWSWKTDAELGGGVLSTLGAHVLYLLEWLLGEIVITGATLAASETAAFAPQDATPAPESASFTAEAAAAGVVHARLSNSARSEPLHQWAVKGSTATAVLENRTASYGSGYSVALDDRVVHRDPSDGEDGRVAAVTSLLARVAGAVGGGPRAFPSLADGARVAHLADDIRALSHRR